MTEARSEAQTAIQIEREEIQTSLEWHKAHGWDGETVRTLPFIGKVLPCREGLWQNTQDTTLCIEFVGMPNTNKTSIALLLSELYPGIFHFHPSIVESVDLMVRRGGFLLEIIDEGPPLDFFDLDIWIKADLIFSMKRRESFDGRFTSGLEAGCPAPVLNHVRPELIAQMKRFAERFKPLERYLLHKEKEELMAFIFDRDLLTLSAKEQAILFLMLMHCIPQREVQLLIEQARMTFPRPIDETLPASVDSMLAYGLLDRHIQYTSGVKRGLFPGIGLFDENWLSRLAFKGADITFGRFPKLRPCDAIGPVLENYLRSMRRFAREKNSITVVIFFLSTPASSLSREGLIEGHRPIMNLAFLKELFAHNLKLYQRLISNKDRPVPVLAINADDTPRKTAEQLHHGLVKILQQAGMVSLARGMEEERNRILRDF